MSVNRSLVVLVAGAVVATASIAVAGAVWYERPTRLTVAISSRDADDLALVRSASVLLKRDRGAARLDLQIVADPGAASDAVDARTADLAVIRTDVAIPSDAQTVVILHRDAALLMARASSGITSLADLSGRTVGLVRPGKANRSLLEKALADADVAPGAVSFADLEPDDVGPALKSGRVAAVLDVDVASSAGLRAVVRTVAAIDGARPPSSKRGASASKSSRRAPPKASAPAKAEDDDDDDAPAADPAIAFIKLGEAEAMAQRSPAFEKVTVLRGMFGGSPPRPSKDYDTVGVSHRLVANENVSPDAIARLTRFFLTEREALAAAAPIALRIEAPDTDKGAALPVHAGSAAYIDDDEQTFFDRYSDMIYIGAMILGVIASGVTAVTGRLKSRSKVSGETGVERLIGMVATARAAPSEAALDALQTEADGLMADAVRTTTASDDQRLTAFGLTLDQVRAAIRDRRGQIADQGGFPSPTLLRAAE